MGHGLTPATRGPGISRFSPCVWGKDDIRTLLLYDCVCILACAGVAQAGLLSYEFQPTPAGLCDLDHSYGYKWGLNWSPPDNAPVVSAKLEFENLKNRAVEPHILDIHFSSLAGAGKHDEPATTAQSVTTWVGSSRSVWRSGVSCQGCVARSCPTSYGETRARGPYRLTNIFPLMLIHSRGLRY